MTERFRISYDGASVDPARSTRLFHFWVSVNDEPRRHVGVAMHIFEPELELAELALGRLELELRAAGSHLFSSENHSTEIQLWDEIEALQSSRPAQKECVWQKRGTREWTCLAHVGAEGTDVTTPSMCGGCRVPDARVVCAHLMKPGIGLKSAGAVAVARAMELAPGCMAGQKPEDGTGCHLGGKPCWERVLETHISSPLEPPPDLPRSVADELDFLRLVARDRLKIKDAVPVPQARTISELFGHCDSAEDLQRRVAALGDLLNHLDFIDALDAADQKDDQGEKLKSLGALAKLLEVKSGMAGSGGPVSVLRSIVRVRNTFPIHTQIGSTRESFRELGIDYPPTDWQSAWTTILVELWSSIRRVREALQTI